LLEDGVVFGAIRYDLNIHLSIVKKINGKIKKKFLMKYVSEWMSGGISV
jgi:hypothetical protein